MTLQYPNLIVPHYYVPPARTRYRPLMIDAWTNKVEPFLHAWHLKTAGALVMFPMVLLPKQVDGSSCGVMVIAQVYTHLRKSFRFQQHKVDAAYIRMLRLQLLWIILVNSNTKHPTIDDTVLKELVEHFNCGSE